MDNITKSFVFVFLVVCILKIEFFPLSNYQMYSRSLLPEKHYTFYKFYGIKDGKKFEFKNQKFGLFHSERPFIESYLKNKKAKGDDSFLKGIYHFGRVSQHYDRIEVYKKRINWVAYKKSVLNTGKGKIIETHSELVGRYPDAQN